MQNNCPELRLQRQEKQIKEGIERLKKRSSLVLFLKIQYIIEVGSIVFFLQ